MLGPNRWPLLLGLPLETFHASPRVPKPALPVFRLAFFCRSSEPVFGDPCAFHSPGILSLSQLLRNTAPGSQLSASITEASSGPPSLGPKVRSMDVCGASAPRVSCDGEGVWKERCQPGLHGRYRVVAGWS